jgi:general secretion pathway protein D
MVRDRDTVAMGGLLRDVDSVTFTKVPLLGDIPVLGWLFKSKSRTVQKINLLFFMTPKILAPYSKTASSNTMDVMAKREQGMQGIFEGDDKDPSEKSMQELKAKVEVQKNGPLYNEEDAALYKNLNDKTNANLMPEIEEPEVPDYLDISKSIE